MIVFYNLKFIYNSDSLLRLLVNLTAAPHLCFEQNPVEEASNDSSERKAHEMELMSYLVAYKEVRFL